MKNILVETKNDNEYNNPYDVSNMLILPSYKKGRNNTNENENIDIRNKKKIQHDKAPLMSRSRIKKLEKILDAKVRKQDRINAQKILSKELISESDRSQLGKSGCLGQKLNTREKVVVTHLAKEKGIDIDTTNQELLNKALDKKDDKIIELLYKNSIMQKNETKVDTSVNKNALLHAIKQMPEPQHSDAYIKKCKKKERRSERQVQKEQLKVGGGLPRQVLPDTIERLEYQASKQAKLCCADTISDAAVALDTADTANSAVDTGDNSAVDTSDNSAVDTSDNSAVDTSDNSAVDTSDNNTVDTSDNNTVDTGDNNTVDTGSNSTVDTGSNSTTDTDNNSNINTQDNTIINTNNDNTNTINTIELKSLQTCTTQSNNSELQNNNINKRLKKSITKKRCRRDTNTVVPTTNNEMIKKKIKKTINKEEKQYTIKKLSPIKKASINNIKILKKSNRGNIKITNKENDKKKIKKVQNKNKSKDTKKNISFSQLLKNITNDIQNGLFPQPSVKKKEINTNTTINTISKEDCISKDSFCKDSVCKELNEIIVPKSKIKNPFIVEVKRDERIQESRTKLPVCRMEQEIIEKILYNDIVLVSGETGSGKTTQIPQFLYEIGKDARIVVTQPRRIAAIAASKRIEEELGVINTGIVGYHIRYDSEIKNNTKIKIATEGILQKEIQEDFLLTKYTVVIIDEAHERGLNTDILLGQLSRIVYIRSESIKEYKRFINSGYIDADYTSINKSINVKEYINKLTKRQEELLSISFRLPRNNPSNGHLKLLIMSATLRIKDFSENINLFKIPPPLITIPTRQHKVTVHFSRYTPYNYLDKALQKVCRIHTKQPKGTILVFLTGKKEIEEFCTKLRAIFAKKTSLQMDVGAGTTDDANATATATVNEDKDENENENENEEKYELSEDDDISDSSDSDISDSDHSDSIDEDITDDINTKNNSDDTKYKDINKEKFMNEIETYKKNIDNIKPLKVLPQYALLPQEQQSLIFKNTSSSSSNERIVVVSTNVAETSITIPNVRYVVDCGREKIKKYNLNTGSYTFKISFISKSSAEQRAGRSGRTGPGHTYRLYSSALYDNFFTTTTEPEILCQPLETTVLQMKSMCINNILTFPFPTKPMYENLKNAIYILQQLDALKRDVKDADDKDVGFFLHFENAQSVQKKETATATATATATIENDNDNDDICKLEITDIGKTMSYFPLHPRFSRFLIASSNMFDCLPLAVIICSQLTVPDIFIKPSYKNDKNDSNSDNNTEIKEYYNILKKFQSPHSDILTIQNCIGAVLYQREQIMIKLHCKSSKYDQFLVSSKGGLNTYQYKYLLKEIKKFCKDTFLRYKAIDEILKLREQIIKLLSIHIHPLGYSLRKYIKSCTKDDNSVSTKDTSTTITTTTIATKFYNTTNDTITIGTGDIDECLEYMDEEEIDVLKPLKKDINSIIPKDAMNKLLSPTIQIPTQEQEITLIQLIILCFQDKIARRMSQERKLLYIKNSHKYTLIPKKKVSDQKKLSKEEIELNKYELELYDLQDAYEILDEKEPVFLHHDSILCKKNPEYVCYIDMQQQDNGRRCTYINNLTIIKPEWQPKLCKNICKYSLPLDEPLPIYSKEKDEVLYYSKVFLGPNLWELPNTQLSYPDEEILLQIDNTTTKTFYDKSDIYYRHFARLYIEGSIVPKLQQFRVYQTCKPLTIIDGKATNIKAVYNLLYALKSKHIRSKQDLLNIWFGTDTIPKNEKFLLQETLLWINPVKHSLLYDNWPPI